MRRERGEEIEKVAFSPDIEQRSLGMRTASSWDPLSVVFSANAASSASLSPSLFSLIAAGASLCSPCFKIPFHEERQKSTGKTLMKSLLLPSSEHFSVFVRGFSSKRILKHGTDGCRRPSMSREES